ncbi:MAG: LacI family DNA-binding transcriptional regulator [Chloroflexota bacterium]
MTLKDVARQAGVDASTASRVLRATDDRPVRAETRDRVLQAASDLGYRANGVARSLRMRRTETIGLVVPDIGNPTFGVIFTGIQAVVSEVGWHCVLVDGRPTARTAGWDRLALEGRVDGLLVFVATIRDPTVRHLARAGFPMVLVNRRSHGIAGSVVMDDARGAAVAVEHLAALGHRRIGHIMGPPTTDTGQRRLQGFRETLDRLGLPFRERWVAETDYSERGGQAAARRLIEQAGGKPPTALYVASFMSGVGAMRVLTEAGLRVPDDVSIVVSDELSLAAYTAPPLTTIRFPLARMGEEATRMLLRRIEGGAMDDIVLDEVPELVPRGSTAPPPANPRWPDPAGAEPPVAEAAPA